MTLDTFNREVCKTEGRIILDDVRNCTTLDEARAAIYASATGLQFERQARDLNRYSDHEIAIMRDCTRVIRSITAERSDNLAGFSVAQALWDIARDVPRNDLNPGFFAEMVHLFRGMRGLPASPDPDDSLVVGESGREAAVVRSRELDGIWAGLEKTMKKYHDGLSADAVARREERKKNILEVLGGSEENWNDWRWQVKHIIRDCRSLSSLVVLSQEEKDAVERAVGARLPFGITPYYASLMDKDPEAERDTAIRTQVIPPARYVDRMTAHGENRAEAFDFMLEADTSPVDLITRRYPSIVILKPFNTCPQICVYCQRNWEIDQAMAPGAMAHKEQLDRAIEWIADRPAIREVLVTGGDPLSMGNKALRSVLDRVAKIPHVEMIRIGSRVPVTLPMRITDELADMLGSYRVPGVRDVALVTHIEHVYEVTPELVRAVDRLKRQGISVYNQHVYTFFVSRRFEAVALRRLIRRCGIDPYYTFAPKGKDETADYRVPVARLLQEQKEEARLLPGTKRTDEVVYNVPGLGKNYLRALQHRDLISVLPDGSRVYEFHPWEKNIIKRSTYVGTDIPVLTYLQRLEARGENASDYSSIWYYF